VKSAWAVFKRELAASFYTPLAYVILVVFLLWNGFLFSFFMQTFATNPAAATGSRSPLNMLFGGSILYFLPILLFAPALTMRAFAEERRTGTFETLMTAPVRAVDVVLGKYFAVVVVYATMWAPTILYALVIKRYGPVDWGAFAAGYVGTILMGSALLALGVLASAIARGQLTAFILGFFFTSGLFVIGLWKYNVTEDRELTFFSYINLWEQIEHFALGIIDSRHVVYYVSITVLALFLTVRAVEVQREG
jgi:ABC-2 type transport system permease protein